ncbi:hypothetical protein RclHR1_10680003 [Rhizophagus clarus]|uniref:Uncharacterized protein n=1 Tax=Rhizophagus clarus TaxID=94130 RepID=A0A2Z6QE94_9GLOM|nr:hypothetical protein RclHR1_10680003 [Rhizophagus clarus]
MIIDSHDQSGFPIHLDWGNGIFVTRLGKVIDDDAYNKEQKNKKLSPVDTFGTICFNVENERWKHDGISSQKYAKKFLNSLKRKSENIENIANFSGMIRIR